jgi:hypothetical protein
MRLCVFQPLWLLLLLAVMRLLLHVVRLLLQLLLLLRTAVAS